MDKPDPFETPKSRVKRTEPRPPAAAPRMEVAARVVSQASAKPVQEGKFMIGNRTLTQTTGIKQGESVQGDQIREMVKNTHLGIITPRRESKQPHRFHEDPTIYDAIRNYKKGSTLKYLRAKNKAGEITDKRYLKLSGDLAEKYNDTDLMTYFSMRVSEGKMKQDDITEELIWYRNHEHLVDKSKEPAEIPEPTKQKGKYQVPNEDPVDPDEVIRENWNPHTVNAPEGEVQYIDPNVSMKLTLGKRNHDDGDLSNDNDYPSPEAGISGSDSQGSSSDRKAARKKPCDRRLKLCKRKQAAVQEDEHPAPQKKRQAPLQADPTRGLLEALFGQEALLFICPHQSFRVVRDHEERNALGKQSISFGSFCEHVDLKKSTSRFLLASTFIAPLANKLREEVCDGRQQRPRGRPDNEVDSRALANILETSVGQLMLAKAVSREEATAFMAPLKDPERMKQIVKKAASTQKSFDEEFEEMRNVASITDTSDVSVRDFETSYIANGSTKEDREKRNTRASILRLLNVIDDEKVKQLELMEVRATEQDVSTFFFDSPNSHLETNLASRISFLKAEGKMTDIRKQSLKEAAQNARMLYDAAMKGDKTSREIEEETRLKFNEVFDGMPDSIMSKIQLAMTRCASKKPPPPSAKTMYETDSMETLYDSLEKLHESVMSSDDIIQQAMETLFLEEHGDPKVKHILRKHQDLIRRKLCAGSTTVGQDVLATIKKKEQKDQELMIERAINILLTRINKVFVDKMLELEAARNKTEKNPTDLLVGIVAGAFTDLIANHEELDEYDEEKEGIRISTDMFNHWSGNDLIKRLQGPMAYVLDVVSEHDVLKQEKLILRMIPDKIYVDATNIIVRVALKDEKLKGVFAQDRDLVNYGALIQTIVHAALYLIAKGSDKPGLDAMMRENSWKGKNLIVEKPRTRPDMIIVLDDDDAPAASVNTGNKKRKAAAAAASAPAPAKAAPRAKEQAQAKESAPAPAKAAPRAKEQAQAKESAPAPAKAAQRSKEQAQAKEAAPAPAKAAPRPKGQAQAKEAAPAPADPRPVCDATDPDENARTRKLKKEEVAELVPLLADEFKRFMERQGVQVPDDYSDIITLKLRQHLSAPRTTVRLSPKITIFSPDHNLGTIEDVMKIMQLPCFANFHYTHFKSHPKRDDPSKKLLFFLTQLGHEVYATKQHHSIHPACLHLKKFIEMLDA
jgi:hypothetical protein